MRISDWSSDVCSSDLVVVEAQAVDDCLVARQPEHARLRVARLRLWRDRADLDEAEAQRQQRVDVGAVLVQPRGQADRVAEGHAERARGTRLRPPRTQRRGAGAVRGPQRCPQTGSTSCREGVWWWA